MRFAGNWSFTCLLIVWISTLALAQERPVLSLREGHDRGVIALRATAQDRLTSVSADGLVKVWDTTDGGVLYTLYPYSDQPDLSKRPRVTQAEISLSGDWVALMGLDAGVPSIGVYDLKKEKTLSFIRPPETVQCIAVSENAVFVQTSKSLTRYSKAGDPTAEYPIPPVAATQRTEQATSFSQLVGGAPEVVYDPVNKRLALTRKAGDTVIFLEAETLKPLKEITTGPVYRMAFSPDGERLAASFRARIAIIETRSGEVFDEVTWDVPPELSGPDFTPFWTSEKGLFFVNSKNTEEYYEVLSWEPGSKPSDYGPHLATTSLTAGSDGVLYIGSFRGSIFKEQTDRSFRELPSRSGRVTATGRTPDGNLVTGSNQGEVVSWSRSTGQPLWTVACPGSVVSLDITPDGRILSALFDKPTGSGILFWDLEKSRLISTHKSSEREQLAEVLSLGSDKVLGAGFEKGSNVVFEALTGKELARIPVNTPVATTYLPQRGWIVQQSNLNHFSVWSIKDGVKKVVALELPRRLYMDLDASPDGSAVYLSGIPSALFRWDPSKPEQPPAPIHTAKLESPNTGSVLARNDGAWLFTTEGMSYRFDRDGKLLRQADFRTDHSYGFKTLTEDSVAYLSHGRVLFTDLKRGELLGYLGVVSDPTGWVAVDRDGYFDGDENGLERADLRLGNEHFNIGQFFLEFYRPGVLGQMLSCSTGTTDQKRLTNESLKLPPKVEVVEPVSGNRVGEEILVKVKVVDQGAGVSQVGLYHNGHKLPNPGVLEGDHFVFHVRAVPGMNEIRATAYDSTGSVEARQDEVRCLAEGVESEGPKLHLLAVGIEDYQQAGKLKFAEDDATAFVGSLPTPKFQPGLRIILTNAQASRQNWLEAFEKIERESQPQDAFIFYFAGHGIGEGKDFLFLPQDVSLESEEATRKSAISSAELAEHLTRIPATRQLVILDACHSGSMALSLRENALSPQGLQHVWTAHYLSRMAGTFLIAASASSQTAAELEELRHGVLTYALLQSLDETRAEGDVSVNFLLSLVSRAVRKLAKQYEGVDQNVVQFSSGQDFVLY